MNKFLLAILSLSCIGINANAQRLAFPEAQGWGRFAVGGQNGSVYHVTNLNDSGAGSLRDAVTGKNRIIVFDVAGVIHLNSRLVFGSNLYVAGQSAPGEGITVYGNGVSFSGATNTIVRYMRFRMGVGGDSGKDCAGVANGTNMIFDHCSFAWGRDETFSINPDGKGDLHSITIQNCVVGQGLMSHSAGGLIQADNITLYRNFYCDNSTRNNKVKGKNQYVNNLVYNWKDGAYIMGGDSEGQSYCNIEGNLFINGPMGDGNAFSVGNTNFHCYMKDNIQDKNRDGQFNPTAVTNFAGSDVVASPYDYPELETISANQVYGLLSSVGASYPERDFVDYFMVDECHTLGKEGAFLSNENSLPFGNPDTWKVWKGESRADSDKDGIPDIWEEQFGTDPQKNDAMTKREDGYTNIEYYLNNMMSVRPLVEYLRAPQLVIQKAVSTTTMTIGWRDWTEHEQGYIVEVKTADGDFAEVGRTEANVNSIVIKDLTPGTAYDIRVRAFAGTQDPNIEFTYSDYSDIKTFKTKPEQVGLVDPKTYEAEAVCTVSAPWSKTDKAWNTVDELYTDGMNVLFKVNEGEHNSIAVNEDVAPGCILVDAPANSDITFQSQGGVITGETSMNVTGGGNVIVEGEQAYTGATVVNDGSLTFYTLADGGKPSGIGASEEFAQNWVFNGGAYIYDGSKNKAATTNRNAQVLKDSKFEIKGSATKLTMNGTFEGNGALTIAGEGTIQPNTTKFFGYKGATILEGGTLYLPWAEISNNGIGSSSKLVFAGGSLTTKGETEGYENYTFPIEVLEGTTSYFSPNRNCYIKNTFTGSGTLQINFPYVREYLQGNFDNFTGRIIANATANGNLCLLNAKSFPKSVIELKNGARIADWATEGKITLGGLAGPTGTYLSGSSKQTNNFTCTWTVGTANTDETFRGIINNWSASGSGHQGTVNIIKAGTGIWRLTGANEYKGTTTVNAGTLIVNGAHSGTGAITVNKSAKLCGTGSLAGAVSVKANGTIGAGDGDTYGKTLTLKAKLTVSINGEVNVPISYNGTTVKTNYLTLTGGAAFTSATLNLETAEGADPLDLPEGTQIKVFTKTGTVTGSFSKIIPERPGANTVWDTTDLISKGILKVITDPVVTSIQGVNASDDAEIYDLNGVRRTTRTSGINIINGKKVRY